MARRVTNRRFHMITRRSVLTALAATTLTPTFGRAQDFPGGMVRLVVPYPAGGGVDGLARPLAEKLRERWGQSVLIENKPAATVNDNIPFVNIMPFPTCIAPTNPAGMAKVPVPTPAPCIPVTTSPWVPPSPTTKINGKPALCMGATLMCTAWAGVITIINPGTTKEIIN